MNYDIGILTFWDVPNYGTFAQAYALQKTIEKRFPERDCRQIAYLNKKHFKSYYSKFPSVSPLHRAFYSDFRTRCNPFSKYNKKQKMFLQSYDEISHTEEFDESTLKKAHFDTVILGSDIVWDFTFKIFDYDPFLFGVGFDAEKISSYAASFGTVKLDTQTPPYVSEGLSKMSLISVRDKMSSEIVKAETGKEPEIVLDPTYLWDFDNDSNIPKPEQSDYMIVYGQDFNDKQIKDIIEYAKRNKLYLICLDCNNDNYDWCDLLLRQYELTPFRWIGYFKYASAIATTTFHGLTFSLIFNKKFAFCKTKFIMDKAGSYLKEIGLYDFFNDDKASVTSMLETDWNRKYDGVNDKIAQMRTKSYKFLDTVIQGGLKYT